MEYCRRVKYRNDRGQIVILLGKIIKDDQFFFTFETAKQTHLISKSIILTIEETTTPFKKEDNHD